jgi:hypothetical protein
VLRGAAYLRALARRSITRGRPTGAGGRAQDRCEHSTRVAAGEHSRLWRSCGYLPGAGATGQDIVVSSCNHPLQKHRSTACERVLCRKGTTPLGFEKARCSQPRRRQSRRVSSKTPMARGGDTTPTVHLLNVTFQPSASMACNNSMLPDRKGSDRRSRPPGARLLSKIRRS